MALTKLNPKSSLNKAFLKVKPNRVEIEKFKSHLIALLDNINETESEEFHKNLISEFLKKTYYDPSYYINTKGRNDLVIHNGREAKDSVAVIIEAKKPTNKAEMLKQENINTKAFQELVLYFLRERITHKNHEIKCLVATNINEWFIFDATVFEKNFAQNKQLVAKFNDFVAGRLSGDTTDFFYKEIAQPAIAAITTDIEFTYFDIRDYDKPLRNADKKDDNKLIALFKLLTPEHLLKLPFINDSNSLDKRFYSELLHIIGLTESKEGSKKLIQRKNVGERDSGSLLENAIDQLDSLDKLSRLVSPSKFGLNKEEKLFNVGLELVITWINRILFLKLLEAQLLSYHKGDKSYSFLKHSRISNFDDLNSLFFQVLARKNNDRNEDAKKLFSKVPYLNSSLFEPTEIEHTTLLISNLRDEKKIPIISSTVLKDENGKKRTGELSTLEYLFEFLDAYDFASEGSEEIQEENKALINASVLGLIFEKINGYKDGSFFTPGFVTMYMSRETIRRAVVQKFNEAKQWECKTFDELYDKIEDRKEANEIINSIKICDPAVGSGHFLVSALNEIIAIKSDLKVLLDRGGKRLKEYQVEVVNDELIITDEDGEFFEYKPTNNESQRIQEALFHEKQTIIEGCLFGVDINPNSVKICRLRLWIELLKNAYYKNSEELETLPNIDINIKCGNSLISRFGLDSDLKEALKKSKLTVNRYKSAVDTYRNAISKEQKREMELLIEEIKTNFRTEIYSNDPKIKRLEKLKNEFSYISGQSSLFEETAKEKKVRKQKLEELHNSIIRMNFDIEEIKSNKIYENAFEWRFEFPDVLNENGEYLGFDVVVGNPPYGVKFNTSERNHFIDKFQTTDDIYTIFIELSKNVIRTNGITGFITPITWLTGSNYLDTRKLLLNDFSLIKAINLPYNIFIDAFVDTGIYFFVKGNIDNSLVFEFSPKAAVNDYSQLINIHFNVYDRVNWVNKIDKKININESGNSIFVKIESIENKLGSLTNTARGILADKKTYTTDFDNPKLKKVFVGNLNRYSIDKTFNAIEYGDNLKEKPSSYDYFQGTRILVRRIVNRQFRLMATITHDEFVCKKDIYILKLTNDGYIYEYLLAIINSKLISYFKTKSSGSAKKDDFTQITLTDLRQLGIPAISLEEQEAFKEKVNSILSGKEIEIDLIALEKGLDQLIYKLYKLTDVEIQTVESSFSN